MSRELNEDIEIRVVEPPEIEDMLTTDLDDVAALETVCFSNPWPIEAFEFCLHNEHTHCLVIRRERRVVAYLIAACRWHEALIANLGVDPSYRGQGLARKLMEGALALGGRLGMEYAILDVRVSNEGAIQLYRSLGFSVVARRSNYYKEPDEDALVMHLTL